LRVLAELLYNRNNKQPRESASSTEVTVVTHTEPDFEDEYDPDEEDEESEETEENESEESDGEAEAKKPKRSYDDIPEGFMTLVQFAKHLGKPEDEGGRDANVKPQVLYSTAKNTKSFPYERHTDGRFIISVDKGLNWWDEKEARKATRAAAVVASPEGEPASA
jgi:hypothetical protein